MATATRMVVAISRRALSRLAEPPGECGRHSGSTELAHALAGIAHDQELVVLAGGGARSGDGGPGVYDPLAEDEDLVASALAKHIDADVLVLATDMAAVAVDRGTRRSRDIREATPFHLRTLRLTAGPMGSKVEAVCRFVDSGGRWAAIGDIDELAAIVAGESGTRVVPGPAPIIYHTRAASRPAVIGVARSSR